MFLQEKKFALFIVDLLAIPLPSIYFIKNGKSYCLVGKECNELPPVPKTSKGRTIPELNLIILDVNKHEDNMMLLVSLAHEIRHIYQYLVVNKKEYQEDVGIKTVKKWHNNLKKYKDSTFKNYEDQDIEIDANAFAYIISMVVLGKQLQINNCNQDKLQQAINDILITIPLDEIKESAKYCGIKVYL